MVASGAYTENFRSALNGFNRTDVVQFIQRQTVEHEKALRLLREENARLLQDAANVGGDTDRLQEEINLLQKKLAECEAELSANRDEIASLTEQNDTLYQEQKALQAALAEKDAAPKVQPAPVKTLDRPMTTPGLSTSNSSNFNEMELAAYRRAELTERMARERATAAADRMHSIFTQAEEKLTLTASDMEHIMEGLRGNYEQMATMMEHIRGILAESNDSLRASAELSGLV